MTFTIDITAELEARLLEEAAQQGLAPQDYIVQRLQDQLQRSPTPTPPCLPKEEAQLLQKINQGLPQATWQHYHQLLEKRRAETLASDEKQILISLSDQIEEANSRRMEHLVHLAQLRHTSLTNLMEQLGIKAPADG